MDYQEVKRLLHPDTTRDAIWEIADKQDALKKINEACLLACEAMDELQEYKKLGSLEEIREAAEKQKPKKPMRGAEKSWGHEKEAHVCPTCDYYLPQTYFIGEGNRKITYCDNCGQAIDWSEDE